MPFWLGDLDGFVTAIFPSQRAFVALMRRSTSGRYSVDPGLGLEVDQDLVSTGRLAGSRDWQLENLSGFGHPPVVSNQGLKSISKTVRGGEMNRVKGSEDGGI